MRYGFIIVLACLALFSCRRDEPVNDASVRLEFSTDTVFFDTVFTTIGSITERIKVFNPQNKPITIEGIQLQGGQGSNFKFNANGVSGKSVRDVEVAGNDSIFIFIEVTVDPNGGSTPLVIEDNIIFQTSGGTQSVALVAWGQDAYFYPSTAFSGGFTFELPIDKPNVFYGYSLVDTGSTLIIPCGARVHFHDQSGLIVGHEASLKVLGCEDDPVIIQGDRLEDFFEDVPGQWGQIALTQTSKDNEVRNAIIKNGGIGLSVGFTVDLDVTTRPNVVLENVEILNMSFIGLIGIDGDIQATNTVVANCGDHTMALAFGGQYDFNHCSFVNFWSESPRSKPVLLMANLSETDNEIILTRDLNATFTNSIFYGSLDEELEFLESDTTVFNFSFDHCILRTEELPASADGYTEVIFDTPDNAALDLRFESASKNDYRLTNGSSAIDRGKVTPLTVDADGNMRDATPDLGAYEYIP